MYEFWILIECGFAHGLLATVGAESEVDAEDHEHGEGEDLEGEAGYHDVVAYFGVFVGVRFCGSDAPACGLEEEREDVAWDELVLS